MAIRLAVPYSEKDEARQLGAIWNPDFKVWVIPDPIKNIDPFTRWFPAKPNLIVCSPYNLLLAERLCWKCKAATPIVALGAERFFSSDSGDQNPAGQWVLHNSYAIFCGMQFSEKPVLKYIQDSYPFFQKTFSNTLSSSYFANTCVHCRKLQGEFFIIEEVDSPFFPDMETGRIKAKIAQMELPFDYFVRGSWVSQTSEQS